MQHLENLVGNWLFGETMSHLCHEGSKSLHFCLCLMGVVYKL